MITIKIYVNINNGIVKAFECKTDAEKEIDKTSEIFEVELQKRVIENKCIFCKKYDDITQEGVFKKQVCMHPSSMEKHPFGLWCFIMEGSKKSCKKYEERR